jgi:hypothetical protein
MILNFQVQDVRHTNRTVNAIETFQDKLSSMKTDAKGFLLSRVSTKKIPYAFVYHAGPVANAEGKYSVRINLPIALKQFAGTRYGIWKATGQPNGFEFTGFSSQTQAAQFVKNLANMSFKEMLQFLKEGDGSDKFQ